VKLAVEQFQVTAVSWSSTWKANERIRIANTRLDELDRLIQLGAADRIPAAIVRLHQAYADAERAVDEVVRDTGNLGQMRALDKKLAPVGATLQRLQEQRMLPASAGQALPAAIDQPPVTLSLTGTPQRTPTSGELVATTLVGSPTTTLVATTTEVPTTQVPTTTEVPTTTQAPTAVQTPTTTTGPPDASSSPEQGDDDSGQGSSEEIGTTLPSP
jgi:hypothetical protein